MTSLVDDMNVVMMGQMVNTLDSYDRLRWENGADAKLLTFDNQMAGHAGGGGWPNRGRTNGCHIWILSLSQL